MGVFICICMRIYMYNHGRLRRGSPRSHQPRLHPLLPRTTAAPGLIPLAVSAKQSSPQAKMVPSSRCS